LYAYEVRRFGDDPLLSAQFKYFLQVMLQFIESRALGVGAWDPWHGTDVEATVGVQFNEGGEGLYGFR